MSMESGHGLMALSGIMMLGHPVNPLLDLLMAIMWSFTIENGLNGRLTTTTLMDIFVKRSQHKNNAFR